MERAAAEVMSPALPVFVPAARGAGSDAGGAGGPGGPVRTRRRRRLVLSEDFCSGGAAAAPGGDGLALVYFVGQLMGVAVRGGCPLGPLRGALGPLVWKPLAGARASFAGDVARSDGGDAARLAARLRRLSRLARGAEDAVAAEAELGGGADGGGPGGGPGGGSGSGGAAARLADVHARFGRVFGGARFVAHAADGTPLPLCAGGEALPLTLGNCGAYAALLARARAGEASHGPGAVALRAGFTSVVPEEVLRLFTWRELEALVCGEGPEGGGGDESDDDGDDEGGDGEEVLVDELEELD